MVVAGGKGIVVRSERDMASDKVCELAAATRVVVKRVATITTAVPIRSAHPPTFYAFAVATTAPLLLVLIASGGPFYQLVGIAGAAYVGHLMAYVRDVHRWQYDNIALAYEKEDLARRLQVAYDAALVAQREAEEAKKRAAGKKLKEGKEVSSPEFDEPQLSFPAPPSFVPPPILNPTTPKRRPRMTERRNSTTKLEQQGGRRSANFSDGRSSGTVDPRAAWRICFRRFIKTTRMTRRMDVSIRIRRRKRCRWLRWHPSRPAFTVLIAHARHRCR